MQLDKYPRPQHDTGIGLYYMPDAGSYTRADLHRWLDEVRSLGTSWLVLASTVERPVPEYFLRELLENDIEPVIGILSEPIAPLEERPLETALRNYGRWGVRYLYFYCDPNEMQSWSPQDWMQPALVDRFMEMLMPPLQRAVDLQLHPLLTPLSPGGTYWDTAFLIAALEHINDAGKHFLFDRMGIGIHNWSFNRPLGWGKGGGKRWRDSRPYSTPPDSEDQRGFYLFEWYDEIVRKYAGYSLPQISVGGGPRVGDSQDDRFPPLDEATHATRCLEAVRLFRDGEAPDYLFCTTFYLVGSGGKPELEAQAWFKADGGALPVVAAFHESAKAPRLTSTQRAPKAPAIAHSKPIYHYLLFGQSDDGIAERDFEAASNYIKRFRPSCGFNVEEAFNAEFVTVIGDASTVPEEAERLLRAAGCKVERVAGLDSRESRKVLDEMAKKGQRFRFL